MYVKYRFSPETPKNSIKEGEIKLLQTLEE
jgi:hypothetical protein